MFVKTELTAKPELGPKSNGSVTIIAKEMKGGLNLGSMSLVLC